MRRSCTSCRGRRLCEGTGKIVDGVFPGRRRAFGINTDQRTTAVQDEGEWRRTAEQGVERFMAKWIPAEKFRAGLRHAVCSMPERKGKDQSEDSPKQMDSCLFTRRSLLATRGANLYPPGVWFADRCHIVFLWCYVCFVFVSFSSFAFTEAAALRLVVLRSSICMRPDNHTQLPNTCLCSFCCHFCFFLFLFLWRCHVFRIFLNRYRFSRCMEITSYVFSFQMVFFYLMTMGWIFDISLLCDNSINQSIVQLTKLM